MARLDDTSDATSQNWVDSYNPAPSPYSGSSNSQGIDYGGGWNQAAPVSYDTPYFGGSVPSPAAEQAAPNSWYGGSVPSPQQYYQPAQQTFYQPGYTTGGGGGTQRAAAPVAPPPPPVHHTFQEFLDNGQAATDPTYVAQKAALVGKLNDYKRNVASQIGDQNLSEVNDPNDKLLGSYYKGNALGDLYKENKDVNGDSDFVSTGALSGGTLGKDYDTSLANFNNQQQHGLRGIAEDFASRGMLGSGSGVWQTARNNAQDQYRQQLNNFNDSTVNQYNSLLGNLADQYSQGRGSLTGYLTDASNRMATAMNAGLPTSV